MSSSLISIALAASLVPVYRTVAASSFKTNCTLPPEGTNYVSGPNTRGTLSILWNCLSIIILCTWNILHLNIPARRPHTRSLFRKTWWAILDSRTKIKWMIITVLVPEYLVGKALNDWLAARYQLESFPGFRPDGVEWEIVHGYYANLGGFVLDFTELDPPKLPSEGAELADGSTPEGNDNPPISHASAEDPVGYIRRLIDGILQNQSDQLQPVERINLLRMRHGLLALNLGQLYAARQVGLIQALPRVSAKELEGLDRGDTLVKAIAVLQVLWLIIQLIVRKCANLQSSQLEVAALAFATSSVMTYILYLGRPQGVVNITKIKATRLPTQLDIGELISHGPMYPWTGNRGEGKVAGDLDLLPIPNDACNTPATSYVPMSVFDAVNGNEESLTLTFGAIIGGAVFGGVHCIAWNFHFPTTTERLFWRIASVLTTTIPLMSIPFNIYWLKLNGLIGNRHSKSRTVRSLVSKPLLAFLAVYLVGRLFIMVEIFPELVFPTTRSLH